MPRSGLQFYAGQSISKHQELYYSDYEIEFLYQIVIHAQKLLSPKVLPTNALFTAYFALLEQLQISPEHDDRYAHVLFRICSLRGPGTLLEKFEYTLCQMGIGVEFYNPRRKEEDFLKIQRLPDNLFTEAKEKNHLPHISTPKRRNSENSIWDIVTGNNSQLQKRRINSLSSIPHPKPGFGAEKDSTQNRLDFQRFKMESFFTRSQDFSNTQLVRAWLEMEALGLRSRSPSGYDGSKTDKELKKLLHSQQNHISLPASTDFHVTSMTTPLSSLLDEEAAVNPLGLSSDELLSKPETLLEIKAKMIFNQHFGSRVISKIQAWKNVAKKLHSDNLDLNYIAFNHYSKNVLRSAFNNWRIGAKEKKDSKQISRYYNHLKKCATKARKLYLLYVAFSHWSNFTTERIQLTAKIRKRIIQTRIFNAWRDISSVDELKAKHKILKIKFCIWKLRHMSSKARENDAIVRYRTSMIRKYISVWKFTLLTDSITNLRTCQSLHSILIEWNLKSQGIWKQQCNAEIFRQNHIYLNVINPWILRTKKLLTIQDKAKQLFVTKMIKEVIFRWSSEVALVLTLKKFQNHKLCRQTKLIFFTWLHQTREERRATATDRIKITREAWTNWLQNTRAALFRLRSNNCIIRYNMYNWILQSRSSLALRLRNRKFLRDMIHIWNLKWRALRNHHQRQDTLMHQVFERKTMNFVLLKWYCRMEHLQKDEIKALNLYQPQILKFIVRMWVGNLHHLQKLDGWSRDAGYYLLASGAMKRWKTCTERAKRNRRKNGYAIVRRKIKINLLRRVMRIWIKKSQEILNKQIWATEINHNRICVSGKEIFYRWRSYAKKLLGVKMIWQEKSLLKYIAIWLSKKKHVLALEQEAIIIYQERQKSKVLQKWSHYFLHVRAYENFAYEICEKNFRKNKRRMFINWRDRVKFQNLISTQTLPDLDFEQIAQNEARSEFGEEANNKDDQEERDFNRVLVPSSIPAYLNTPSKRSERIKAVVAKYSKTPMTPLPKTQNQEFRVTRTGGLFSSIKKKTIK
ncbi:putative centrin-binding protein sfi1 [Erysiphe neolycopersici]|uniref:Putative centrin-binding protein sfi1 n=1 Tax=Erysiphe neolycopersici TaxID=212602 RepID=A0A420I867_9PEZI|nr:putative centrin-binding protein sfi1 [Erysiphe neolycopersici]